MRTVKELQDQINLKRVELQTIFDNSKSGETFNLTPAQLDDVKARNIELEKMVTDLEEAKSLEAMAEKNAAAIRDGNRAANQLPLSGAPYVAKFADTWKYDNLTPGELGLVIATLQSAKVAPSISAYKAVAIKLIEDKRDFGFRDLGPGYSIGAMKAAGVPTTIDGVKAATDPMYTGGTTDGGNWVHTAYSRELWAALRAPTNIVSKIPAITIPDGWKSATFPVEGVDFTWYTVSEASSSDGTLKVPAATVAATQITTPTNKEITVAKMGARGLYTGELTEDSLLDFAPRLMENLRVSGSEQLEHAVIDGDSTTTAYTNVNDVGNGSTVTAGTLFLMLNGFRKLALVTNTANSRSAGGSLDEDDYLETMWLMGTAGLAGADLSKCAFIIDPNVYKASLKLSTLKTKDVWTQATVESGVLTKIWGYPIYPSWFMHYMSTSRKSNTAGKVDQTTPANNAYGAILGVRWDQWKFANKRLMTIETNRIANADSYEIVSWARLGLGYRDTEASAISYYVGV